MAISLKLRSQDFIKPISELSVAHLDRGTEEALLKPATRLCPLYRWPLKGSPGDRKADKEEESSYVQTRSRVVSEDEASGHSLFTSPGVLRAGLGPR